MTEHPEQTERVQADALQRRYLPLWTQHQRRIFAYIYTLIPNRADAEDLLQETSITLWEKFETFEEGTNFVAWACQIAYWKVRNARRKYARSPIIHDDELLRAISDKTLADQPLLDQRQEALAACLEKLKERDRDMVMSRYESDRTIQDIAKLSGRSVEAAYKALSRIRRGLLDCVTLRLEGRDELVALLKSSEDAQQTYLQYMSLSSSLIEYAGERLSGSDDSRAAVLADLARLEEQAEPMMVTLHDSADWRRDGVTAKDRRAAAAYLLRHSFTRRRLAVLAAAAMVFLSLLAWMLVGLDDSQDPQGASPGALAGQTNRGGTAQESKALPEPVFATVVRSIDAGPELLPGQPLTARELSLDHGLVELQLLRGATVILQGPCRFELIDGNQLFLFEGKLAADVPPKARRFTVQTPSMRLVDLGTRFGAAVNAQGDARAAVFEGEVLASPGKTPQDASASHSLKGGDAINASITNGLDPQPYRLEPDHGYLTTWHDIIHRVETTGQARYFVQPPANIGPKGLMDPDNMIVFREKEAELQSPIKVLRAFDGGLREFSSSTLPSGTRVMSYLIHFAHGEEKAEVRATLRFPGRVLGLVANHNDNLKADAIFGLEEVDYWGGAEGTFLSSIDPGTPDRFEITGDEQNILVIALHARRKHSDRARVLIEFDIDSIVIRKNGNQTFGAGSTLTLYVWQGSVADWEAGSGIIALLIAILLPALSAARQSARQIQNQTQLRGIHQGFFIQAQSNKTWMAGVDANNVDLSGAAGSASNTFIDVDEIKTTYAFGGTQAGAHLGVRYIVLLEDDFAPPEYFISPAEVNTTVAPWDEAKSYDRADQDPDSRFYSFAGPELAIGNAVAVGRTREWRDDANGAAVVVSDRLLNPSSNPINGAFPDNAAAQDIDVYFVAGQSNAGNIGEQNGTGSTDVGFTLTTGHLPDRPIGTGGGGFPGGTAPSDVLNAYSSNLLDTSKNVNQLAINLYQGNDIAIYSFGRNGRALTNVADTSDDGESWYPGDGTTNYDSELYGDFQAWSSARLAELALANPGSTATVKGVFWFQGEGDVGIGSTAVNSYQDNFENLVDRFRDDFNEDVAVVATKLRIVTNATQQGLNDSVNTAIENAAAADDFIGFVETTVNADGTGGPLDDRFGNFNTDVHFSNAAQEVIVGRWAEESLRIQNIPEPSTLVVFAVGAAGLISRRRRA
eukprot:g11958.t1